jgi:hemolysin III
VPLSDTPVLRGWVHLIALPLAIVGLVVLWRAARRRALPPLPAVVFGVCLIGLFAVSALYHVPRWSQPIRGILARADVAMIQCLIAGTFTPVAFHTLRGRWRTASLTVAWVIAGGGAVVALAGVRGPVWAGVLNLVVFGWLAVLPMRRIMRVLAKPGIALIVLGGVLYTVGSIVLITHWPDPLPRWFGYWEVWHVFVVAAAFAHFLAIWRYVLRPATPQGFTAPLAT